MIEARRWPLHALLLASGVAPAGARNGVIRETADVMGHGGEGLL